MSTRSGNPFAEVEEAPTAPPQTGSQPHLHLLFKQVYWLLFLRTLYLVVFECYFIYDSSCSHFFSGSQGLVVILVIFLIQSILSMYISTSDDFGPENPTNRRRFIWLNLMQGLVYSGAATNLYQANKINLVDVAMFNGCTGSFYLLNVAFLSFKKLYHGLFGAISGLLITISALVARLFLLQSDDQHLVIIVAIGVLSLLSCCWYSFETHSFLLVRKQSNASSSSSSSQGDAAFFMMCLAYVNVWRFLLLRQQQPPPLPKWTETKDQDSPRPDNQAAENNVDFDA